MDHLRTHLSLTVGLARISAGSAADKTLGSDRAAPQVASVESNNPPPEAASMVRGGGSVGQAMVPKFSSPNNIKVRPRTPNLVTPKRVLRAALSTLINVANNIGNK